MFIFLSLVEHSSYFSIFGRTVLENIWQYLVKLNIYTLFNPSNPFLDIYTRSTLFR